MRFSHHPALWAAHPDLVAIALQVQSIHDRVDTSALAAPWLARAGERLAASAEGGWPEIQAWRRRFAAMGLEPTRYRCAAESLLRRLRKESSLPALHPLVDLCNAASVAFATPIAVFDLAQVDGALEVRPATGEERYADFGGAIEHPERGEVIFADAAGNAHARRWCHRQSGLSAVRSETREVLIVAEAMHAGADADLQRLAGKLGAALATVWGAPVRTKRLEVCDPLFEG